MREDKIMRLLHEFCAILMGVSFIDNLLNHNYLLALSFLILLILNLYHAKQCKKRITEGEKE